MASLYLRFVGLICWIFLLFNIERIAISATERTELVSGIYLLCIVVAIVPLLPFSYSWKLTALVVPVIGIYFLLVYLSPTRTFGGLSTYITFTGLFLVIGTTVLSYRVGQTLKEFNKAVELVTFPDSGSHVRNLEDAQKIVELEMSRSRRNQSPLSLIVLQSESSTLSMTMHRMIQDIQRSMMQRYVLSVSIRLLLRYLRRSDLIIQERKPGQLIVLMPETADSGAAAVGERIVALVEEEMGIKMHFGTAAFPKQALTFEELLRTAEESMGQQQSPDHLDMPVMAIQIPERDERLDRNYPSVP